MVIMAPDPRLWDGLGVPPAMLKPGLAVMVAWGTVAALANGTPALIAYAEVVGPASESDAGVFNDPSDVWWLNVHMGPGAVLPQMYRADQILGIPALGLAPADGAAAG